MAPTASWGPDHANTTTPWRLPPLASLAGAPREGRHAVARGIATLYNSRVRQGRITDVKLQKRLIDGRAGVSILRHRVVLITHLRQSADRSHVTEMTPDYQDLARATFV
ncbi:hypothetical protein GCM10009730_67990 [Streptomyces albidochromogenes]